MPSNRAKWIPAAEYQDEVENLYNVSEVGEDIAYDFRRRGFVWEPFLTSPESGFVYPHRVTSFRRRKVPIRRIVKVKVKVRGYSYLRRVPGKKRRVRVRVSGFFYVRKELRVTFKTVKTVSETFPYGYFNQPMDSCRVWAIIRYEGKEEDAKLYSYNFRFTNYWEQKGELIDPRHPKTKITGGGTLSPQVGFLETFKVVARFKTFLAKQFAGGTYELDDFVAWTAYPANVPLVRKKRRK